MFRTICFFALLVSVVGVCGCQQQPSWYKVSVFCDLDNNIIKINGFEFETAEYSSGSGHRYLIFWDASKKAAAIIFFDGAIESVEVASGALTVHLPKQSHNYFTNDFKEVVHKERGCLEYDYSPRKDIRVPELTTYVLAVNPQ